VLHDRHGRRRIAAAGEYAVSEPEDAIRRSYVTRLGKQRMHQQEFRQRVLAGLPRAVRHLPAAARGSARRGAHPAGRASTGEPVVPNGLALCKLHHAAFDRTSWACGRI